ncbi:MAG: hypothetical protein IJE40_07590 [Clostridia bacterium]|nr:hypothetical protein [Clostridia bacterium]
MIKNILKETIISLGTSIFMSIIYLLLFMGCSMLYSAANAFFAFLGDTGKNILLFVFMFALFGVIMYVNNHVSYDYAYKKTFDGKFNEKEQLISLGIALVLQLVFLFLTLGDSPFLSTVAFGSAYYSLPFCGIAAMIFGTEYIGTFVGAIVGTVIFYVVRYFSMLESYRYVVSRSEHLLLKKKKDAIEGFFSGEKDFES